jgi:transcriptional regulator with XRE-family HTH domain
MKKQVNRKLMTEWLMKIGQGKAIGLLMSATGLSMTTIDKIIRDKYPSQISYMARQKIAETTGIPESELFK